VAFVVGRVALALLGQRAPCPVTGLSRDAAVLCGLSDAWIASLDATMARPSQGGRAGADWAWDARTRRATWPTTGRMVDGRLWVGVNPSPPLPKGNTLWSTPVVRDAYNTGGKAQYTRHSRMLNAQVHGAIGPRWAEALQGLPDQWLVPAESFGRSKGYAAFDAEGATCAPRPRTRRVRASAPPVPGYRRRR
jgi:hypothetical protein